jgi:hypothetical protein
MTNSGAPIASGNKTGWTCLPSFQIHTTTNTANTNHCMAPVRDTEHAKPAASKARAHHTIDAYRLEMLCMVAAKPNSATKPMLVSEAN